jgi:prepilin-type N-terminal cleavage/methylation domain-containing protein
MGGAVHPGRARRVRRCRRGAGDERGYTLIEMLVSTAIMLVVAGGIFALVDPGTGAFRVQPEVADMQQRLRVGVDMLYKDLVMAGAGTYMGPSLGALQNFFPPIKPYRTGTTGADGPSNGIYYRPDAISLLYVPNTASQTTVTRVLGGSRSEVEVAPQPNCPKQDQLCGFREGQTVLMFDASGSFGTYTITNVQSSALHLQFRGQLSGNFSPGASITQVDSHVYYYDAAANQLRHYDGGQSDLPLVDNVVGLTFRYFGDPNPPLSPKPTIGTENCLFDTSGNPKLPVLAGNESLVELPPAMLTDGPWCNTTGEQFDADLYRIRKVHVQVRVQVGAADLRGGDTLRFARPGTARSGARMVPDYTVSFEVAPRNMNLTR